MLLYVMRIMNKCIINLILIKCCVILMAGLILLLMIEDVICCLRELCFVVGKLIIWIMIFLGRELMAEEIIPE